MDALAMLKADHDKVKGLLKDLEATTERGVKTRQDLFATIKGELTVHEIIEEEIFYPALKSHPKAKDIVLEAYEEHRRETLGALGMPGTGVVTLEDGVEDEADAAHGAIARRRSPRGR